MAEKENWIGGGLIAVGTGIGVWSIGTLFIRHVLINDYIEESKTYRDLLLKMPEDPSERQARLLDELGEKLERKERMIREMGFLSQLREAVTTIFGAIVGVAVTIGLLRFFWRRYRPPAIKYKCPLCDKIFDTDDQLNEHIRDDHNYTDDLSMYATLVEALAECSSWFIEAVAVASGVLATKLKAGRAWWDGLSKTDKILIGLAIAVAVLLCIAVAWWFMAIGAGAKVAAAAIACAL